MVTEHYIPGAPRSRIQRGKLRKGKKNDDLPMRHDRNPGRHRMAYGARRIRVWEDNGYGKRIDKNVKLTWVRRNQINLSS